MEPLNLMVSLSFYGNDDRNRAEIKRARRTSRKADSRHSADRGGRVRRTALWLRTAGAR